jgi:pantoate--beta-alanine ligase
MILFKTAEDLTKYLSTKRKTAHSIGFVPTLGALHAGHISLIENSKNKHSVTVASIFVNPTQFNDAKDFAKYPVTIEQDIVMLEKAGCDVLFLPGIAEIYPAGTTGLAHFEIGRLETILEGKYRPGHFQGVCQVMDRLLKIVMPGTLFLGQKDYQQCMVISQLIRLQGLPTEVSVVPTLREASGLAMSSRNMRLSETGKQNAVAIYRSLLFLREHLRKGDITSYKMEAANMIKAAGFEKIDYAEIADAVTLETVDTWNGEQAVVGLVAAFIEGVRLIDNIRLA